jgi:hypothetical protein
LKIFLDKDVHTMALERIRWVFANFAVEVQPLHSN